MNLNKIKNFLKDKTNLTIVLIILFGILVRIYYLIVTYAQPLWWDEAEYLLMAKYFATGIRSIDLLASRPLLLPIILAFFMKIGLNYEIIFRLIEIVISSLGLVFIYLSTKELFNKEVGIVSTLLLSVFYLNLFYTERILLDSIAPTFWVISIYFFTKGYINKKDNRKFYLSAFFGSIGIMFYNQTMGIFILYLIFLLISERLNLFKEKRFYIFGLIAIITFIPNFILNQILYKNPIEFVNTGLSVGNFSTANYSQNILIYLKYLPFYLGNLLLAIFIISLVILVIKFIIGIDLIIKNPNNETKKELFIFLWLLISFLVIIKIVGHFEDRYIMPTFIPLFIISSLGIYKIKEQIIKPSNRSVIYAVIILLLLVISFTQLKKAEDIIKPKAESFKELKEAGIWIKENSNSEDKILTSNTPILLYYSERKIISFPEKEEELISLIQKEKPKYILISVFTGNPNYINNVLKYNYLKPMKVYQSGNALILAVFEIEYNKLQ